MKKILLCLFLLTSLSFYAQVSDTVHCSGDNNFDLSKQKIDLIGNLDPAQTTVSYHLSLEDATNDTNAIANSSNYNTAASSTTIYARIDNNGTITTNSFNVKVTPALNITATNKPILCKGETASLTINVSGGSGSYQYSINGSIFTNDNYYSYLPGGIYNIQVRDAVSSCITTTNYTIAEPTAVTVTNIVVNQNTIINTAVGGTPPYRYSLDGINNQTSNIFPSLTPGSYIVRVMDSEGCGTTVPATILPALNAAVAITKEIDCISNASITVAAIGGKPSYAYSLNGGVYRSSNIFNNLTAGNYYITVKDALNSTFNTSTITIAPPVPVNGVVLHTNPTSCSNASITIHVNSGQAPYYYSIDNGITFTNINTFPNLQAGTYVTFIKDSKNCVSPPLPVTVDPVQTLMATATVTNVNCKGSNDGVITINATSGTAPYTYSIGNSYVSSNIFNNLSAEYYNVSVKDALGCIYTMVTTIVEPTILSMTTITTNSTSSADNDGTMTVNAMGGVAPYTYAITNSGFPINPFQTSTIFTGLKSGSYDIYVKDVNGCIYFQTNIIAANNPNSLVAAAVITPTTCTNPIGTISINVTGGTAPYQYSLDNGANYVSSNVFNLVPGNYSITVRDIENTTTSIPVTIADLKPVFITATLVAAVSCNGASNGSITTTVIQGQTPYIYKIDNVDFYDSNAEYTFNNLPAGELTIQVTDSNSCTSFVSITIPEPTPLNSTVVVNDKTISINTTGGVPPYSYTLQDNDTGVTIIGPQGSNIFTNLPTGVYSVQVVDSTICSLLKTGINISNSNGLSVSFSVSPITCANPTATITVVATGGSGSYEYSLDNGINYTTSNVFTGLAPGTDIINVRDTENNTTTSMLAIIAQANTPSISATVNSNILCKGGNTGSITAIATGGQAPYTYSLDGITFNTSNVFTNLRVGTFNIIVKDTNGCNATTTIALREPAEDLSATAILINDQGIIVNAKGGTAPYNYYLQNNNGIVVAGPQKEGIFTRLAIGRYSAQVTDANGCGYIHWSVDVEPAAALSATVQVDSIKCNVPGTITVNATGGFQPYYYSYDNGTTYTNSNVYTSFKPGTYTVKVRDYQNTTFSIVAIITQGSIPVINVATTNISCKGDASGSITANVTTGLAPYTYSLDNGPFINGNSNITFTNLYAGTHNITVKDANGCLSTNQVVISEPVSALMTVTTVKNQSITINATGGAGNYRYAISPNLDKFSTNNIFSELTPGTYVVNTSDVNGCYITMNAVVDPPAPLINGQIKLTLEFKPGQTLADLIIDGQNIKWYINQNPLAGKTSKTSEVPLPLSTVIVDGTTYYASQTINGIESTERLAVTVKSATLGTTDLVIKDFTYYPNPVKNIFTISNTSIIDEISLISIKGETLLTKKINSLHHEIDLSNFSKGVYFLKVKAEETEKTVKLIKE